MEKGSNATPFHFSASMVRRVLFGAALGLAVISFFIFRVSDDAPDWGPFWRVRPLIVTPLAGACAGMFYHLMDYFRVQGGWKKILANIAALIVYIVGLWMGIVLGLVGTMWN